MYARLRSRLFRFSPVLALLAASACSDAPTVPEAIQRLAGGEEWVALPAPVDLPHPAAWSEYISSTTAEGRAARARVRELDRLAREAQRDGRPEVAVELRAEAEQVAIAALDRNPAPEVLLNALGALDFWRHRVSVGFDSERYPELTAASQRVGIAREGAMALLAAGDTAAAMGEIVAAAATIREHTPEAVALRVLAAAEGRIAGAALEPAASERAIGLLLQARQELISGDPRRALHRALYALQIVEGRELRTVRSEGGPGCAGVAC
jgi:hypothetical protein